MKRRTFISLLGGAAAAWPLAARGQQAERMRRIGFLSPSVQTYQHAFREGLRALGYVEGQNIAIEYRFAEGNDARLPELAKELVASNVDLIVATNASATQAAKDETKVIPIVMVASGDPLLFVQSLSRPGGNITGTGWLLPDMSIKQLELLKELDPQIDHVAVLWSSANPSHIGLFQQLSEAAKALRVQLNPYDLRSPADFAGAFEGIIKIRTDALLVLSEQVTIRHRSQIIDFANSQRIPTMYALKEFVISGGLMSYGVHHSSLYFRAATYVDKLLRGIRPADLPVELPTKYELFINLKAAKALGLEIPSTLLARADEVIE